MAVVRDMRRRQIRWYVNGLPGGTRPMSPYRKVIPRPTRTDLLIGRGTSISVADAMYRAVPFRGQLDELVVSDRGLSSSEIKTLYELGKRGKSLK